MTVMCSTGLTFRSFIVNFGTNEDETKDTPPEQLTDWHCDGPSPYSLNELG